MVRHRITVLGFIIVLLTGISISGMPATDSANDILVIVNKSVEVETLSIAELKQIFLKKKSSWPGGNPIVPINARVSEDIREEFREKVLDMSNTEESTYWETQKIRLQLSSPVEMGRTPKAVFKLKNAISYAYRRDVPTDVVKVVQILPN